MADPQDLDVARACGRDGRLDRHGDGSRSETREPFIPARDVFELQLTRLWEEVLGIDAVGVRDTFFALGGDLPRAGAMLGAVAQQFGTRVELPAFLEGPTVERLGCLLRRERRSLGWEPLVALQPKGTRPPLFFVPGGDGIVFNYHRLARAMGPDQPLHGLQVRGLYKEGPVHDQVEERAAEHLVAVRAVQPRGPYLLAGHCVGGIVALEMALQLQAQGERVALLAAIEGPAPVHFYGRSYGYLQDPLEFLEIIGRGFKDWFGRAMPVSREELLALAPERRSRHFMERARAFGAFTPDAEDDHIDTLLGLFRAVAFNTYTPRGMFSGDLLFFRGSSSNFCRTDSGGWETVCERPHGIHEVPGDHCSVVTEDGVDVVVRELRAAIARALEA